MQQRNRVEGYFPHEAIFHKTRAKHNKHDTAKPSLAAKPQPFGNCKITPCPLRKASTLQDSHIFSCHGHHCPLLSSVPQVCWPKGSMGEWRKGTRRHISGPTMPSTTFIPKSLISPPSMFPYTLRVSLYSCWALMSWPQISLISEIKSLKGGNYSAPSLLKQNPHLSSHTSSRDSLTGGA